eukprot:INCI14771.9.p1 GENE.INCI14771.9~~INCI14771.9.p1  ORF type:complete len:646 (+),score=118.24 INCI14771.9:216-1940(+)
MFNVRNVRAGRSQDVDPETWETGKKAILITGIEVSGLAPGGTCTVFTKVHPGFHENQKRQQAFELAQELQRPCLPPRTSCDWSQLYFDQATWKRVGQCEALAASGRNTFILTQGRSSGSGSQASSFVPSTAEDPLLQDLSKLADMPSIGEEFQLKGVPKPPIMSKIALQPPIRVEPGQERGLYIYAPESGIAMNIAPEAAFMQKVPVRRGEWGQTNLKEGDTIECYNGVKRSRAAIVKKVHSPAVAGSKTTLSSEVSANLKNTKASSQDQTTDGSANGTSTEIVEHSSGRRGPSVDVKYLDNGALRSFLPIEKTRRMDLLPAVAVHEQTLAVLPGRFLSSREPFQGLARDSELTRAAFWGRLIYREETLEEREHQEKVDRAHQRLRKQLDQLGTALSWFRGEGNCGQLPDDSARVYLHRRNLAELQARVSAITLKQADDVTTRAETRTPFTTDVPFLLDTELATLRQHLSQLQTVQDNVHSLVPESNLFLQRLKWCIAILTQFCTIKEAVGTKLQRFRAQVLGTLELEMAEAKATADLFLMRKVGFQHRFASSLHGQHLCPCCESGLHAYDLLG